jgi:hypothetical protein
VHFQELSRDSEVKFKEEGMRIFVTWLLAFGMIVSPAMAGTDGTGDAKNATASNTTNSTTTADKEKAGDTTTPAAKTDAGKPAPASLESELQQLRDLIEAQSKLLQAQSEQLKEQQQRMQVLESEVSSSSVREGFVATTNSTDPDGHTAGVASTPVGGMPTGTGNGSPQLGNETPAAIHFKGITITPGGFLAAETVFRNKAMGADINTPFNSVPFPGNSGGQTTEFNGSARQSRLSMLAEGKLVNVKLTGYVETDFLGAGITSNDNESNSYVLRLRQGWGQAKFDNGWSVTGGQMWSLVTETKKAVDNRSEGVPLTIDPQYTVGFSWARQYGFRVAKTFGDKFTLAASVEESATTATVHGNPTITDLSFTNGNQSDVTTPTLSTTTYNNFLIGAPGVSSGLYNPTGTYAYSKTPDFVFKAAVDPGWGHFEVFGLVSEFRDRAYPCYYANGGFNNGTTPNPNFPDIPATACLLTGSNSPTSGAFNNSRTGGGIGANARVPLLSKKVEIGVHFLGGNGIGRYGTSGLPDSTVRPDGTLALLRNYQALGTIELHPTPKLDVYMYVGGEYSARASYTFTNAVTGATGHEGYGSPSIRNDGCNVEPLPVATPGNPPNTTGVLGSTGFIPGSLSNCAGDARNIIEGTLGFWYRIYAGEKGRIQWGPQYSYIVRNTWVGSTGTAGVSSQPHGIDNMIFTSFRYYLP